MIRTEQEILKDFEKLRYKIKNTNTEMILLLDYDFEIKISKLCRTYRSFYRTLSGYHIASIGMKEHKLLHDLFLCWGWLDEKEN